MASKTRKAKRGKSKQSAVVDQLLSPILGDQFNLSTFDIPPGISLDELIVRVNKQAKKNVLKRASDASNPFLLRRPFGIASLDCATGGGVPAGGITQIAAPDGVGKNSLCNRVISQVQRLYGEQSRIGWVWLEVPYDKMHARINGVVVASSDMDIMFENMERSKRGLAQLSDDIVAKRKVSVGEFIIGDEGCTERRLQAVLDLVAENQCQIIVIDSIGSVVSKYRVETDMEDEPKQSASASLLSDFQRMCWHNFSNPINGTMNTTSLIVINQVRANRNRRSTFDKEWTSGGPWAIRHGKLLDVTLSKGERIGDKGKEQEGKWVRWEVMKGKVGCHEGGKGEVAYNFKSGFDAYQDVIHTANSMGLLIHQGLRRDLAKPDGEVVLSGLPWGEKGSKLLEALYDDYDLFDKMYYTCLEAAEVSCLHKL
jgi:RecA/RadA recombinase